MAFRYADRVQETRTVTGTGAITLGTATAGFIAFSAIASIATNDTVPYTIFDSTANAWEVGIGTYNSTGPTLTRTTVLASSNSGSAVSFAGNSCSIFLTQPAARITPNLVQTKTAGYTIVEADRYGILRYTGSAAATFTLPAPGDASNGWAITIRHEGTGTTFAAKKLTITAASGNVDGVTSFVTYPGEVRTINCDGSNFYSMVEKGFAIDILNADSPATFSIPTGYSSFDVYAWGAGGGGASGRRDAAGNDRAGGSGGGGGAYLFHWFRAADLGTSVTATVGAGGTAGAAQTTNSTDGNNGGGGGNTTFGTLLVAYGGGGGCGGGNGGLPGGSGAGYLSAGGQGANSYQIDGGDPQISISGNATQNAIPHGGGSSSRGGFVASVMYGGGGGGASGPFANDAGGSWGGNSFRGGAGGGGGGGVSSGNTVYQGARGGASNAGQSGGGGAAGGSGAAGTAASTTPTALGPGMGGGGGGGSNTGVGFAGGVGGIASGGGGGGVGLNGFSSGAGAAGGGGLIRIRGVI